MSDTYTAYFNEKPFIVTNTLSPLHQRLLQTAGTVFINHPSPAAVQQCISSLDATEAKAAIIYSNDVEQYWAEFQAHFTPISAGGGLVENEAGAYLFMFRRGAWDLPKGKQDPGESIAACALREVQEETGLQQVQLKSYLTTTWHTYRQKQIFYLKQTVWYRMQSSVNELLIPQAEEDITALRWMAEADLSEHYASLFPSIKDVLAAAKQVA